MLVTVMMSQGTINHRDSRGNRGMVRGDSVDNAERNGFAFEHEFHDSIAIVGDGGRSGSGESFGLLSTQDVVNASNVDGSGRHFS